MASVVNEPNGRRRIEFFAPDGRRKKLRLGKVSNTFARSVAHRIERLVSVRKYGEPPDDQSRRWLDTLDDVTHARLAKRGVVDERQSLQLEAWLDQFLEARQLKVKASSAKKLRQTKAKLIEFFGGKALLRKITPARASEWCEWMRKTLSLASVKIQCGNAKTIFAEAVRRKLIPESPFAHLAAGPTARPIDRYVTEEELWSVVNVCPNTELKLWLALPFYGMLRVPSETETITWDRVDLNSRRLKVHRPKTERFTGHDWVTVPIPSRLHALLMAQYAARGDRKTVFRLRKSGYVLDRLADMVTKSGVLPWPDFFVTLRASGEMFWQGNGIDEGHAARLAGHSTVVSRRHY